MLHAKLQFRSHAASNTGMYCMSIVILLYFSKYCIKPKNRTVA